VASAPVGSILQTLWNKIRSVVNAKQDKLTAGSNITISGNTISASSSGGANLNRTVGSNDNSTGTVTDTGSNISVPISVTTIAATATDAQHGAKTTSLRSVIQTLLNNVAWLFKMRYNGYGLYEGDNKKEERKVYMVRWGITGNDQSLQLDSRLYTEGEVVMVRCYRVAPGANCSIKTIFRDNGTTNTILSGIKFEASCAQPFVAVFVRGGERLELDHTYYCNSV
jgi:hypothetical protein